MAVILARLESACEELAQCIVHTRGHDLALSW